MVRGASGPDDEDRGAEPEVDTGIWGRPEASWTGGGGK